MSIWSEGDLLHVFTRHPASWIQIYLYNCHLVGVLLQFCLLAKLWSTEVGRRKPLLIHKQSGQTHLLFPTSVGGCPLFLTSRACVIITAFWYFSLFLHGCAPKSTLLWYSLKPKTADYIWKANKQIEAICKVIILYVHNLSFGRETWYYVFLKHVS